MTVNKPYSHSNVKPNAKREGPNRSCMEMIVIIKDIFHSGYSCYY